MIHHYLTEEEKIHLNELHNVKFCTSCNNSLTGRGINKVIIKCLKNNVIVNEYRQICKDYNK